MIKVRCSSCTERIKWGKKGWEHATDLLDVNHQAEPDWKYVER